jgi:hypothetical protein
MKVAMEFDRRKLQSSLKKYSKMFGDNTGQAVTRWGVQVGRELALATQVFGKSKTRKRQMIAMRNDALKVVGIQDDPKRKVDLNTPEEIIAFINSNRKNKHKRVRKLPSNWKTVRRRTFDKAMAIKGIEIGRAKGSWLGASMDIAKKQTGTARISIGKNFLAYAQKWAKLGNGKAGAADFKSQSTLVSTVPWVSDKYVLSPRHSDYAIDTALKSTVKWYRKAIKDADKKS